MKKYGGDGRERRALHSEVPVGITKTTENIKG